MRVFVTGGSGLVGRHLTQALTGRGDTVLVLSRQAAQAQRRLPAGVLTVQGDPATYGDWAAQVSGCDAVVNLAGESLFGKRWNDRQKEVIRATRVETARNIVRAIREAAAPPKTLVSASAIGIYGNVPEGELAEDAPPGSDFLAGVCQEWEAAALELNVPGPQAGGTRVVILRIGVVLAPDGGALGQMMLPFKLGLGGPVGRGRQWVSWVHINDLVRLFLFALDNPQLQGPVNAAAPRPVRNKEFSQAFARALRRPCLFPIPPLVLKLRFGGAAQVVIDGQNVLPKKLLAAGFKFQFEDVHAAMQDLFAKA